MISIAMTFSDRITQHGWFAWRNSVLKLASISDCDAKVGKIRVGSRESKSITVNRGFHQNGSTCTSLCPLLMPM